MENNQKLDYNSDDAIHDMTDKDFSGILWTYFTQHSNQRMQMMNFYIVLETFLFTGMLTLYTSSSGSALNYTGVCTGIGVAVIFFSFVFWNLDRRTRELIHNCEAAIKVLEGEYGQIDERIRIVSYEAKMTCARGKGNKVLKVCKNGTSRAECRCKKKKVFPLLYSESFKLIYLFFSLAAVVLIIYFKSCS